MSWSSCRKSKAYQEGERRDTTARLSDSTLRTKPCAVKCLCFSFELLGSLNSGAAQSKKASRETKRHPPTQGSAQTFFLNQMIRFGPISQCGPSIYDRAGVLSFRYRLVYNITNAIYRTNTSRLSESLEFLTTCDGSTAANTQPYTIRLLKKTIYSYCTSVHISTAPHCTGPLPLPDQSYASCKRRQIDNQDQRTRQD